MSVDLDKLAKQVDEALAKETKESLTNWLNERRQKAEASDSGLHLQRVSNSLLPCGFDKCVINIEGDKMCDFCKYKKQ